MPRSWEGLASRSTGALRADEELQEPAGLHSLGSSSSWLSGPPSCRALECGRSLSRWGGLGVQQT